MFGFIGPAVASLISQLLIDLLQLLWSSRLLKIRFSGIFPWRRLAAVLIINIAVAAVFMVLKLLLPLENYVGAVLESVILGAIWFALTALLQMKRIKRDWINIKSN